MHSTMRLIFTLVALVLITSHDRLVSCDDSSEEDDIFKNYKVCPGGYCLAPHMCRNGSVDVHGSDIIELRFDDKDEPIHVDLDDQSDPCEEFLMKCCAVNEGVRSSPNVPIKPPEQEKSDEAFELPPPTCGINRPNGYVYRVTKSEIAQFAEFPWMAVLLERRPLLDKDTLLYFCGGSLIHPQVILTAAHCVKNLINAMDTLLVRLGEWDTVTVNEPLKHEELGIRKIIIHENYADRIYHNDIALLILEKRANLNVHINPVCLPKTDDIFDDQRCMVSGWGTENFKPDGKYSEVLKKVELPVIPRKRCKQMFKATSLGPMYQLHKSFLCAGAEAGVDTCKGDGGSPLVCKRDGVFVQTGIVAWGIGCGGAEVPGAYVKVSQFVEWIAEKIQQEGV